VSHARAALEFLASDLAQQWVVQGRMVATTTAGDNVLQIDSIQGEEVLLEHPRVFFPSYPWEWTPSAWVAAANLTLELCDSLLDKGLILKDATPLNILFEGAKPVFVDVLSIEKRDPESPLWLAYAQFVRTFLLPLLAHRYLGWPLAASLQRRDGYEPADLYPFLGTAQRWKQPFRSLVTIPYLLDKKRSGNAPATKRKPIRQSPEIAAAVLRSNLRRLRKTLHSLAPAERDSRWSDYPQSADHYSDDDHKQKQAFVRRALQSAEPRHVLDLGANTGVYSRIAASLGASVVAWDTDLGATERNWAQATAEKLPIQPLLADAARPTPAAGWRNAESLGLLDRARGNFDCVMALGLIHHLLVADQIPLSEVAGLFRDLTHTWAIVEWVPADDPRFADLVRGRDELYGHLTENDFLSAMKPWFSIAMSEKLGNGRTVFLFRALDARG
jgi:SAM-dependent methyltransferase